MESNKKSVSLQRVFHSIRFKVNKVGIQWYPFFYAHKSVNHQHFPALLSLLPPTDCSMPARWSIQQVSDREKHTHKTALLFDIRFSPKKAFFSAFCRFFSFVEQAVYPIFPKNSSNAPLNNTNGPLLSSFSFKNTLTLLVCILIVSIGFLILSADILIALADTIRISTLKKEKRFIRSLPRQFLSHSQNEKVRILLTIIEIIIGIFSP